MTHSRLTALAVVLVVAPLGLAEGGEWGHLTGRFYYDGEPPPARTVVVTKDTAALGDSALDESLVINKRNRGIANVLIYLLQPEEGELRIHPSFAGTENAKVDLCMQDGRFAPHILLLRTTQTMKQRNLDRVGHNAKIHFFRNSPMGPSLPASDSVELRYTLEERLPCPISCAIHPWMRGYVLLRSNPYMAKTDANGRFRIENLPVGRHVFQLWHERDGYLETRRIGSLVTSAKGRLTIAIHEGDNEWPDTALQLNTK